MAVEKLNLSKTGRKNFALGCPINDVLDLGGHFLSLRGGKFFQRRGGNGHEIYHSLTLDCRQERRFNACRRSVLDYLSVVFPYSTVTLTGLDGIPFATTSRVLAPVSIVVGTSK